VDIADKQVNKKYKRFTCK